MRFHPRHLVIVPVALLWGGCGGADLATTPTGTNPVTVSPSSAILAPGESRIFTAVVRGTSNQAVTWSVITSGGGTFKDPTGLYTAPTTPGTYTLAATSQADGTKIGTATVSVAGPLNVRISPSSASISPLGTQTFIATVNGSSDTVDWSVLQVGGGTVSSSGTYTAPSISGTYTVIATARADGQSAGTATIIVNPITLSISPTSVVNLDQGAKQLFLPVLTGTSNASISWSVNGGSGTIQLGPYLFTAPASSGTTILQASSVALSSVTTSATISVNPVVVNPLSPADPVVPVGGTLAFSTTATGSTNTAITWSVLSGGAGGTINSSGVYIAPSTVGTDTIKATAAADATASQSTRVTVGSVVISPAAPSAVAATTGRITFSATVTGVPDPGVTWAILPTANNGTISTVGYFSAPDQPGVYRVRATSLVNAALFSEVQVTVY